MSRFFDPDGAWCWASQTTDRKPRVEFRALNLLDSYAQCSGENSISSSAQRLIYFSADLKKDILQAYYCDLSLVVT